MKITTFTEANNALNPTQGLALSALATLASPPQLVANINAQTTLMVTPISLDTASSAELNINLALSEPSSAISATGGPANSSFVRQDLANTVANANVQTTVQVDSMKLFQVSSLSMDITHAQPAVPVPVVGWVYDSIFGTVPWMNDHLLAIQTATQDRSESRSRGGEGCRRADGDGSWLKHSIPVGTNQRSNHVKQSEAEYVKRD